MHTNTLSRQDTLSYFRGDELATDIFLKKYALTAPDGSLEEYLPEQMWHRMASAAASVETDSEYWTGTFLSILQDWKAIPQGSIMFALGNSYQQSSCSNCFTLPINNDSLEDIFDCAKEMSKTYAYRGGVGVDISNLRPEGAIVSNAARTSTGAWSFMDFFSYVTRLIGQHGRRGALMLTIADSHPDLINFINSKQDHSKITGANISVRLSDKFMRAIENNEDWTMSFQTKHEDISKTMPATEIWNLITSAATSTAEPGILFWDTILRESPADCYADVGFQTISVNPCAEISLTAYDACTLLSMYLAKYTRNNFTPKASFDYKSFKRDVTIAVRFQDNVKDIDSERMPLLQQKEIALKGRRIGMGTHGLADTLANLCIKYDSDEAIKFVEKLYKFYAKTVYEASVELAAEKGPFPIFDAAKEKGHPFLERIGFAGIPRRNIACLTCAPTGSVAAECQSSSGIEPVFRNFYTRRRKLTHNEGANMPANKLFTDHLGDKWQEYVVAHHNVQRYLKLNNIDIDPNNAEIEIPEYFVESSQIDWTQRVKLQATIQKYIDHSISSTINLPAGTTEDVVKQVYLEAYKQGCKGCTVYVDGCRDGQPLVSYELDSIQKTDAPKRPKSLEADIYHTTVKGEVYFVMVGLLNNEPYEVFAGQNGFSKKTKRGKIIKHARGVYEALLDDGTSIDNIGDHVTDEQAAVTRLMSLSLRHGADIKHCVSVLEKVPGDLYNFARSIARVIKKYISDGTKVTGRCCENCNSENLIRQEGCILCLDCGMSGCS